MSIRAGVCVAQLLTRNYRSGGPTRSPVATRIFPWAHFASHSLSIGAKWDKAVGA